MEGAVKFVRFNHHIFAFSRKQIVCAIVFGDTPQEGIASHMTLVQQVRRHCRSGGLAVCACHTQPLHGLGERAQHLCALVEFKTIFAKPCHFLMIGRDGRCVDHQCLLGIAARCRNQFGIIFKMNLDAFSLESIGECGRSAIVACHKKTLLAKIAFECTHADTTGT